MVWFVLGGRYAGSVSAAGEKVVWWWSSRFVSPSRADVGHLVLSVFVYASVVL